MVVDPRWGPVCLSAPSASAGGVGGGAVIVGGVLWVWVSLWISIRRLIEVSLRLLCSPSSSHIIRGYIWGTTPLRLTHSVSLFSKNHEQTISMYIEDLIIWLAR